MASPGNEAEIDVLKITAFARDIIEDCGKQSAVTRKKSYCFLSTFRKIKT